MAGISHINNAYNPEVKRVSSKLSFQMGESFSARVIKLDEVEGEILLKLLDGWHFSAKLEKPLDFSPKGQLRFQIIGLEDGKVILKLLEGESKAAKPELDSLLNILNENNLNSEEYELLEKMLKHEMPLSKENISKVKLISDFIAKITIDPVEEEIFISKYISSKSLDQNSERGKIIKETLKEFFNELKSIDLDDVLIMMENGIDLNRENIASFKRIFKTEAGLYNSLMDIKEHMGRELTEEFQKLLENIEIDNKELEPHGESLGGLEAEIAGEKGLELGKAVNSTNAYNSSSTLGKKIYKVDFLKSLVNDEDGMKNLLKGIITEGKEILSESELTSIQKLIKDFSRAEIKQALVSKGMIKNDGEQIVQNEMTQKTQEMKEVIRNILSIKNGAEKEIFDKVMDLLKPTINDLKVFNTLNNQYYYMDIPINLKEMEYPCKLIIKDDRNKGKKIDSKNVNMVISIKTMNIGTVDGFIKVRDNNLTIDVKCSEEWISTFENTKDKLISSLSKLGYNIFVAFQRREKDLDISSCRDFFNDNSFNNINVKV